MCANKNCPRQTIIAGLTKPVEEAVAIFKDQGHMVHMLEVSHAFHSKVVAEASEPLRAAPRQTDIQPGGRHPDQRDGRTSTQGPRRIDEIRDLLAEQVASPVEFIAKSRICTTPVRASFVECGPKRAQTSFVDSILSEKDIVSMYTNHPKDGDIGSLNHALAHLWARVWTDERRA